MSLRLLADVVALSSEAEIGDADTPPVSTALLAVVDGIVRIDVDGSGHGRIIADDAAAHTDAHVLATQARWMEWSSR